MELGVFMAYVVVVVLQLNTYPKLTKSYTLNIYSSLSTLTTPLV